jgi:hypothetical protein
MPKAKKKGTDKNGGKLGQFTTEVWKTKQVARVIFFSKGVLLGGAIVSLFWIASL